METIRVFNQETGKVGYIARHLFDSPFFNRNGILIPAEEGQKPYADGLFKTRLKEPAVDPVDETESEEDTDA